MFTCPVCGWPKIEEDPTQLTYEICPCCGTEFGYDEVLNYPYLRKLWVDLGMNWWSVYYPCPNNWNPLEQLRTAGLEKL